MFGLMNVTERGNNVKRIFGKKRRATVLLAAFVLASAVIIPTASAGTAAGQNAALGGDVDASSDASMQNALHKTRTIAEQASVCKPETVEFVNMVEGDIIYVPMYGERKEDASYIDSVCGILKKFASDGVKEKPPVPTNDRFFWGMNVTFTAGDGLDLTIPSQGKLALSKEGEYLVLDDPDKYHDFNRLRIPPPPPTIDSNKTHFGGLVHVTGLQVYFAKTNPVFVFWVPENANPGSVPVFSADGLQYPYGGSSLLVYKGSEAFNRYDLTFAMPAYGRALDGRLKLISSMKGKIVVTDGNAGNNYDSIQLLPARKIFLSVDGVPVTDPAFAPLVAADRTLVPVRAIASLAGEAVTWDAATHSVLIRTKPAAVKSASSSAQLWIDGKKAPAELQPIVRAGKTYVPLRAVTAAFRLPVAWDSGSRSVNVTTVKSP
jgi:hypothetical protein